MSKIVMKGGALTAPVPPCMVSCGEGDEANIITIAWTGIINTVPPKTYISVRPSRHSHGIITKTGEFCINLTPASLVKTADFCGIYTGKKVDKFSKCGLHKGKASAVSCPLIEECPLTLECKVTEIIPLGSHDMFIADIVAVDVDDTLIDGKGKLRLDKADLAAFAHGEYFALGKKLGDFGFSVKKKKKKAPNKAKGGKSGAPSA